MILGVGTDIIDIRRIEKTLMNFGTRFEERVFSEKERQKAATIEHANKRSAFFAKRFAAKEAIAKALGKGIGHAALFRDISIENDAHGKPIVILHNRAADTLGDATLHISLADDYPFAQAFAVIES